MKFVVGLDYIEKSGPANFARLDLEETLDLWPFVCLNLTKTTHPDSQLGNGLNFLYEFLVDVYFHVESCTACIMQLDL